MPILPTISHKVSEKLLKPEVHTLWSISDKVSYGKESQAE